MFEAQKVVQIIRYLNVTRRDALCNPGCCGHAPAPLTYPTKRSAVTLSSVHFICAFACFASCLPRQDCKECPASYKSLAVPGNVQAEDFDLGGEVLDIGLDLLLLLKAFIGCRCSVAVTLYLLVPSCCYVCHTLFHGSVGIALPIAPLRASSRWCATTVFLGLKHFTVRNPRFDSRSGGGSMRERMRVDPD